MKKVSSIVLGFVMTVSMAMSAIAAPQSEESAVNYAQMPPRIEMNAGSILRAGKASGLGIMEIPSSAILFFNNGWGVGFAGMVRGDRGEISGAPDFLSLSQGASIIKRLEGFIPGLYSEAGVGVQFSLRAPSGKGKLGMEWQSTNRIVYDNDIVPISLLSSIAYSSGQDTQTQTEVNAMLKLWAMSPTGRGSEIASWINGGLFLSIHGMYINDASKYFYETTFGAGAHIMVSNFARFYVGVDSTNSLIFGSSYSLIWGGKEEGDFSDPKTNPSWVLQ